MERYTNRSTNSYSQNIERSQDTIYESEYARKQALSQQNKQSTNSQVSSVQTQVVSPTTRQVNPLNSQNLGLHSRNPQQSQINPNNDQSSQQYLTYNPYPLTSQSTSSILQVQNSNYQSQCQQQNISNSRNQYDANVNPMQREEQKIDLNQDSSPFISSGNYNYNQIACNQHQINQGANISNNQNSTSFETKNRTSFLRNKDINHQSIQQSQGVINNYKGDTYNINIPNIAQGTKIVINIYHFNCQVPNQGGIEEQDQIVKRKQIVIEIGSEKDDNAFKAVNGVKINAGSIIRGGHF
ncbi:hypothetical protein OXYTRIMIC_085 [Oxytricha trifallax]|uniref:Uncharacterized protein n=1 Tax=Oxytricha trifallax TaxID=1172189 RepID=A0A073I0Y9_9SPIT|nr:hypothetical protein OXYTRIMIC_085 [Oxytricha trifallax]